MPARNTTKRRPALRAALRKPRPEPGGTRAAPANGNRPASYRIIDDFEHLSGAVLLDDRQVAELTGYQVTTVKSWRQHGRGPRYLNINGRARVSVAAVREWLAGLPYASE